MCIDFVFFYHFSFGFWNCSDSVVLELFRQCGIRTVPTVWYFVLCFSSHYITHNNTSQTIEYLKTEGKGNLDTGLGKIQICGGVIPILERMI